MPAGGFGVGAAGGQALGQLHVLADQTPQHVVHPGDDRRVAGLHLPAERALH